MKAPFHRAPGNYDAKAASDDVQLICKDPSLTIESEALDTDINEIVRRFGITGKMPENHRIPQYGDYSEITDYASAVDAVNKANDNFMAMPAETRAKFQNDPGLFLEWTNELNDKGELANLEAMREMKLAVPKATPPAPTQPPTPPPTTEAAK